MAQTDLLCFLPTLNTIVRPTLKKPVSSVHFCFKPYSYVFPISTWMFSFSRTFILPPITPVSKAFWVKVNNKKQSSAGLQFLTLVIQVTTLFDSRVLWRVKGVALSPEATILKTPSESSAAY